MSPNSTAPGLSTPSLAEVESASFSPVENDAPLRWWRRLRLVPPHGLGAGRRALLLALLAWVPIALWAVAHGRAFGGEGEPLLIHYGIHVRCLVVIPLLILAELPLHYIARAIAARFLTSGVVTQALRPDFDRVLAAIVRLRNSSLPWAFAVGAAVAWTIADPPSNHGDEMSWSVGSDGTLGFGGAWFVYVSRPIMAALLFGWLWRLALVTCWMWRVGRLPLALTPAHPDRTGGIAFVGALPAAFALVTLSLSAMFASRSAHQILHHGATLGSYQLAMIAYALGWSILLLMPLFAIAPALWAARFRALPRYAALAGAQGRLVERRWIDQEDGADHPLFEPPGLGVMADMGAVYETVARLRWLPVGKETLAAIALPLAIPFAFLALASMPLAELLQTLLSMLK